MAISPDKPPHPQLVLRISKVGQVSLLGGPVITADVIGLPWLAALAGAFLVAALTNFVWGRWWGTVTKTVTFISLGHLVITCTVAEWRRAREGPGRARPKSQAARRRRGNSGRLTFREWRLYRRLLRDSTIWHWIRYSPLPWDLLMAMDPAMGGKLPERLPVARITYLFCRGIYG